MSEIWKLILTGVGGVGSWAAITYLFSSWLGARIAERLKIKWIGEKEKELERLKADITKDRDILNTSLSVFSKGYQYSQERRLKAIESVWKNVLKWRQFLIPLRGFYAILKPSEYNDSQIFKNFSYSLLKVSIQEFTTESEGENDLETVRPFLGEYIWSLYFAYRAFNGRLTFTFEMGKKENNIRPWNEDKGAIKILEVIFDIEELKVISDDQNSLDKALNLLESKILREFDRVISGEIALDANIEKANEIIKKSQTIMTFPPKTNAV